MTHDVRAVANFFLDQADDDGQKIDHMKVQKLAYIAHGWHLAITGEPLFAARVEAWPHGPTIPELFYELKHHGHEPIRERLSVVDLETFDLVPASVYRGSGPDAERTLDILHRVWANYGDYDALELSTLAHEPNTPWDVVAKEHHTMTPRGVTIPNDLIRRYYVELGAERRKERVG